MSKLLYISTSGSESTALRWGKKFFTNKEVFFNTPEEVIRFINEEHPNLVAFEDENDGATVFDSINKISFSQPVKGINFAPKKVPASFFSLLLHLS